MYLHPKNILAMKQILTALADAQPCARNSGERCKLGLSYLGHKVLVEFTTFLKDP